MDNTATWVPSIERLNHLLLHLTLVPQTPLTADRPLTIDWTNHFNTSCERVITRLLMTLSWEDWISCNWCSLSWFNSSIFSAIVMSRSFWYCFFRLRLSRADSLFRSFLEVSLSKGRSLNSCFILLWNLHNRTQFCLRKWLHCYKRRRRRGNWHHFH